MLIGEKIDLLCDRLNIKKQDLAEKLGITPQHLSAVINGKKNPGESLLRKLSAIANVDMEFFDGDAEAVDLKDSPLMEHLPEDLRDWVQSKQSGPYIILAKMISDGRINDEELSALVKIIRSDRDNTDR
jgi:transcriptional regulator with XRE-family HTH domain